MIVPVFVYVGKQYRGKAYVRFLAEQVCRDFPNIASYVMGDVNPFKQNSLAKELGINLLSDKKLF